VNSAWYSAHYWWPALAVQKCNSVYKLQTCRQTTYGSQCKATHVGVLVPQRTPGSLGVSCTAGHRTPRKRIWWIVSLGTSASRHEPSHRPPEAKCHSTMLVHTQIWNIQISCTRLEVGSTSMSWGGQVIGRAFCKVLLTLICNYESEDSRIHYKNTVFLDVTS
jgi:hypothetical protein